MPRRRKQLRLTQEERDAIRRVCVDAILNRFIPYDRKADIEIVERIITKLDDAKFPQ